MKRIAKHIVLGAVAVLSVACETVDINVVDTSIPTAVSFSICNEDEIWEINTIRTVSISLTPEKAVAKSMGVKVSDEKILSVEATDCPCKWILTAISEGTVRISVYADDLKSKELIFTVVNPNKKPEPEIKVYISKVGSAAAKQDYGPWVTVKYGEQYIVSASCNRKDLTLQLYSSDEKVASFEEFGKDAWIVSAKFPGQTDLQVYVMDGDKEYFSGHEFVVFGEITLQAECSPVFCKAGFSVVDNPFGDLTACIHIDMTLVGWPHENDSKKLKLQVPPYETRNFIISENGEYPTLFDFKETSDRMYDTWTGGTIGSGSYYRPYGAELNYVFTLNNSYITVKMLDDPYGERNWQFYTKASAQTSGVVSYE